MHRHADHHADHCSKKNLLFAIITISAKRLRVLMPIEMPHAIRQKTLDILRERFKPADVDIDSAVYLSEPERRNVLMRITLTSTSESVPKSIILKQVLPQAADADDQQAQARFARDWAGLEFTSRVQESTPIHSTPIFYGSDTTQRFILIEDLGHPHVSLVDSLLLPNRDKAVSALERYMKTLGRFNAASIGHTDKYDLILKKINSEATTSDEDLALMTEYLLHKLLPSIESLDLLVSEAFADEAEQVLDSIFKPGPFTVLTHGDIAPDNVFDHEGPKGLQLIDFEWCAPRNALLDGTYLRMSIPTGWCAKAIPDDVLKPLEQIYRAELEKKIPKATDDLAYSTAYTHACAYHVLHQMANLGDILDKDVQWDGPSMPQYPMWDPTTNSSRSRLLSRLQAFVDVATEHDRLHPGQPPILPNLRKMTEDILVKVKARWGEDAKPLDFYPAFKQDALQLARTQHSDRTDVPNTALAASEKRTTARYKDKIHVIKTPEPRYMAPTESSLAKEREKYSPLQTTPKPPWKP